MDEHLAAFFSGGGEMGIRIRDFDWSQHALGKPEDWSLSLWTTLRLVLTTQHPMLIFWGAEHRCLYNDAYARLIGPSKHPSILGAGAREAWPEIWEIIGPQIEHVTLGRGATWHENQCVWLNRRGWLEESYWTYSFSPIYDDKMPGRIAGTLSICTETTQQVLYDRRRAFLIGLDDSVRAVSNPRAVIETTTEALGRYLGVSRVGFGQVARNGATVYLETSYADGVAPLIGSHTLEGPNAVDVTRHRQGATVVWHDVTSDPSNDSALHISAEARSLVSVPLIRDGRFRACLFVHHREARRWSDEDVSLIEQVATRLWDAVERLRAEAELKLTTQRFELALEHSPISVFSHDLELRYTWVYNSTLGLPPEAIIGKRDADLLERAGDAIVTEAIKRDVIDTGVGRCEQIVIHSHGANRYYDLLVDPLLDEAGQVTGITCAAIDITEREQAEENRKLLIRELDHRVKNTLALVTALSQQTFSGKGVPPEVLRSFHTRLKALACAHDILTRTAWKSPSLAALVNEALGFTGPARSRILHSGPAVFLDPKQAVPIVMAIHELCTNAFKYGALSNEVGTVEISWSVQNAPRWLEIVWCERGGPRVSPPQRRGFGSMMLERALSMQLEGTVNLSFGPDGVTCVIGFPLPSDGQSDPATSDDAAALDEAVASQPMVSQSGSALGQVLLES